MMDTDVRARRLEWFGLIEVSPGAVKVSRTLTLARQSLMLRLHRRAANLIRSEHSPGGQLLGAWSVAAVWCSGLTFLGRSRAASFASVLRSCAPSTRRSRVLVFCHSGHSTAGCLPLPLHVCRLHVVHEVEGRQRVTTSPRGHGAVLVKTRPCPPAAAARRGRLPNMCESVLAFSMVSSSIVESSSVERERAGGMEATL